MSSSVTINCRHDTVNNFFRAVTAGAEHWFLLVSNPVLLLSMVGVKVLYYLAVAVNYRNTLLELLISMVYNYLMAMDRNTIHLNFLSIIRQMKCLMVPIYLVQTMKNVEEVFLYNIKK